MSSKFIGKKRGLKLSSQEDILALRNISNILNKMGTSKLEVDTVKVNRKSILHTIGATESIEEVERVDGVSGFSGSMVLTRAERPITFDVASFVRNISEETRLLGGVDLEEGDDEEDNSTEFEPEYQNDIF